MIKRVGIASLGAIVAVCAIWYGLFWRPEGIHLKAAEQQSAEVSEEVDANQGLVTSLQAQTAESVKEKAILNQLVGLLPYGPSLDEAYDTIADAATASGVQVTSIATPMPPGWNGASSASGAAMVVGGAQVMSITLQINGTSTDVLSFIKQLDQSRRLYVETGFALGATAEPSSMTVLAFYQSATGDDPVFPGQESGTAVSGTTTTTTVGAG